MSCSNKILKPKSEEDILKDMINNGMGDDVDLLLDCAENGFLPGVKIALEKGQIYII
jgi:hypothetical protein